MPNKKREVLLLNDASGQTYMPGKRMLSVLCCIAVCAAIALVGLCGCKETNVVKNVIHDQSAEKVDTGEDKKQRVVTPDGAFTSDDTGLYEKAPKGVDSLAVNPTYTSKDPETELGVPRFEYDPKSKNNSEASEGVRVSDAAPEEEQDEEPEDEERDQDEDQRQDDTDKSRKNDSKNAGKSSKGDKDDGDDSSDGKSDDSKPKKDSKSKDDAQKNKQEQPSSTKPSGTGGDDKAPTVYDTTGDDPEIPDVSKIAAYGQIAVIVQMLGGQDDKTPLVAADDELCASAFSTVFADEGSDQVNAAAWEASSDGGYSPDVAEIIDAKPDTVLVFSDSMFTKGEKKKLAKKDISITVVPALTSDTGIVRAVETVGKMLDKATDGESSERAEAYKKYHDDLVSDIQGGRGYGAYNNVVFDANKQRGANKPSCYNARKFTLLVEDWDYDATFSYKSTITDAGFGVGVAKVGFRLSPASYYLGVAGVVNNAAAVDTNKSASGMLIPAWQFNPSDLKPSRIDFSANGFASRLYSNWGDGFTKTTLVKPNTAKNDLADNGFGSDTFPACIVASQKMRDAFIGSANSSNSLYYPYDIDNAGTGPFHGVNVNGTAVFTTIDPDTDMDAAVLVNPHGLFSSWIDGSAESFLESAWVANEPLFDNDWSGSAEDAVADFYQQFYRYDLTESELKVIFDGSEE